MNACFLENIFLEKIFNSGGVVVEKSGKEAYTAHVTLYHDAVHPSYLDLALVR
jgi:hypothetical protein